MDRYFADGGVAVLSAGSDGIDGNSAAAGAVVDGTTCGRARGLGFEPEAVLRGFESGAMFRAMGDAVMTGPTGNNLRDIRMLMFER
jgi:hydroxypyruvate reductase